MMESAPFFYRLTNGMRITVRPTYLENESIPEAGQFVFAYSVRIENVGKQPAKLLWRRWRIHDSVGEDTEVEGEGVVGEQPLISPGNSHEYQSFCILRSSEGYMEGEYIFSRDDGSRFDAEIPRFDLNADDTGKYIH